MGASTSGAQRAALLKILWWAAPKCPRCHGISHDALSSSSPLHSFHSWCVIYHYWMFCLPAWFVLFCFYSGSRWRLLFLSPPIVTKCCSSRTIRWLWFPLCCRHFVLQYKVHKAEAVPTNQPNMEMWSRVKRPQHHSCVSTCRAGTGSEPDLWGSTKHAAITAHHGNTMWGGFL